MPPALFALTAGAFGIGVTEFVIMGLLIEIGADLRITIATAGTLISGYALGVVVGAPLITAATSRFSRRDVLLGLMLVFTLGNLACALAPSYGWLLAARVLTAFAHGTFFGVGSVVAAGLVAPDRRASAIAIMFTGLTLANILGVPFGTWLGQTQGWRATFWAVTAIGLAVLPVIALLVPRDRPAPDAGEWRRDLEVMRRLPVLLGFLTTVLGFAGVFAVFTYIAPLLTRVSGLPDAAVSPVLLVFGGGLVVGNLLGGKLADRGLMPALLGTLAALAAVLLAMAVALPHAVTAVAAVFLLGAAGFATVPPLQSWVLQQASGAGQSLAASFNIAAFNLGNALGAWLGGVTIEHGPGLAALPLVAAVLPLSALGLAWLGREAARRQAVA
ncbi:MFS transporter [Siccirubricoccus phaeus]|uniref:MFS transporter n=1 Tax=Siccirubricoccus phaeus TaxID=2595053 RepID=UPI0011F2423C|nr:MFS transporter [Siccirubricoccus phaeus]